LIRSHIIARMSCIHDMIAHITIKFIILIAILIFSYKKSH